LPYPTWGLDAKTGIVLGTATVRSVEGETETLLVEVTTDYSLVIPAWRADQDR